MQTPSRNAIQEEALKWVGTKWRHQGRSASGVDCAGLIVCVSNALEYSCPDVYGYSRMPHGFDFLEQFNTRFDMVDNNTIQQGDIVVFDDKRLPCHCGIVVKLHNHLYFVHSHAIKRSVVYDRFIDVWAERWTHSFQFRGVI